MAKGERKPGHFPTKEAVLDFIRQNPVEVGKREIARAFRITGPDRRRLRELLRELENEGEIAKERRRVMPTDRLPSVTVVRIDEVDIDGEVIAVPTRWQGDGPAPRIYLSRTGAGISAPAVGDRLLARLKPLPDGGYEGEAMRRITAAPTVVLGVYRKGPRGGRVQATDRRLRDEFEIGAGDEGAAGPGDLVLVETLGRERAGLVRGRVTEVIGRLDDPGSFSLVSIHTHNIPTEFSAAALAQAKAAEPAELGDRSDLRDLPLVTIDGADARDFDDAVWAAPDPETEGCWRIIVAIADVSWYVRPDDALDRASALRGNSVYFPDRVVPMLPEALSNDLCSLRPNEDRACLAAHLRIDSEGKVTSRRFERALMRSSARLTYEQAQAAHDGHPDETTAPPVDSVIAPLYGAYAVLAEARRKRGALEIDLPERQVRFDDAGRIAGIEPRTRLDSHRLIEEFMIAANVAAAEALESRRAPVMYRVHDAPDRTKIAAIAEFLKDLGYQLTLGQVLRPALFNQVLVKAKGTPEQALIHEVVLRSQSQAVYSPHNLGHFGLGLRHYCHFTSPIRRYSDLLVHRALVRAFDLGPGALPAGAEDRFEALGEQISNHERRAVSAERDAMDRYVTAFMADRVGATFEARINGVTRFGLFVTLAETGADGIVPMRSLSDDYYDHDEEKHCLVGRATGRRFRLGDPVEVRLREASEVTGSLGFELIAGGSIPEGGAPRTSRKSVRKLQKKAPRKGKISRARKKERRK
ncbi:MAG: ribonuclease R [Proteobacteria bacterium]|nr:ribonuclease R [Pseudomonadota bacterium]